jgi:hypothetical protein
MDCFASLAMTVETNPASNGDVKLAAFRDIDND